MIDINKKIFLDNAEFMDKLKLASLYLKAKKIIESSNETIETATRQLHEARTSQDRGECFEAIKEANGKISSAMELVYRQMDKVKIPRDTNLDKLKLDCRIATQKDMENNACYVLKAPYSKPGLQECLAWVVEQAKRTELKQLGKIRRTLKDEKFPNQGEALFGLLKVLVDRKDLLPEEKVEFEVGYKKSQIEYYQAEICTSCKREENNEIEVSEIADELTMRGMMYQDAHELQQQNDEMIENLAYAKKFYENFYSGIIRDAEKTKKR